MSILAGGGNSGKKQGGTSCTTPPLNPNGDISGGEDALVLGFGVNWGQFFDLLVEDMDRCKTAAGEGDERGSYIRAGQFSMRVEPKGFKMGNGKGCHFAYSFQCGGLSFGFSKMHEPHEATPNVWVDCSSLALMKAGHEKCYELAVAVIESFGGFVLWDKLSRVDLCMDWAECEVSDFVEKVRRREVVRRARKCNYYEENYRWTGFFLGAGGDIAFRCYDKELETRKNPAKRAVMLEQRWGREIETATRFEFQMRRTALKSMGVDGFESYLERRADIARYVFREWFRFIEGDIDPGHTERATMDSRWAAVCDSVDFVYGKSRKAIQRTHDVKPNAFALVRQGLGCLVSAIALESFGALHGTDDMKELVFERLALLLERIDLEALHEKAMLRVAAEYPTWA